MESWKINLRLNEIFVLYWFVHKEAIVDPISKSLPSIFFSSRVAEGKHRDVHGMICTGTDTFFNRDRLPISRARENNGKKGGNLPRQILSVSRNIFFPSVPTCTRAAFTTIRSTTGFNLEFDSSENVVFSFRATGLIIYTYSSVYIVIIIIVLTIGEL